MSAKIKTSDQMRLFFASLNPAAAINKVIPTYPMPPQTATGKPIKTEKGDCETVSQLNELEMAQKLRYVISV
jgi:hypothetical protein